MSNNEKPVDECPFAVELIEIDRKSRCADAARLNRRVVDAWSGPGRVSSCVKEPPHRWVNPTWVGRSIASRRSGDVIDQDPPVFPWQSGLRRATKQRRPRRYFFGIFGSHRPSRVCGTWPASRRTSRNRGSSTSAFMPRSTRGTVYYQPEEISPWFDREIFLPAETPSGFAPDLGGLRSRTMENGCSRRWLPELAGRPQEMARRSRP